MRALERRSFVRVPGAAATRAAALAAGRAVALAAALAAAVVGVAGTGCVSLGTHEALERSHAEVQERLAAAKLEIGKRKQELEDARGQATSLADALAGERQRAQELEAARDTLASEIALTRAELERTLGELSQVVKDRSALKGSVDQMKVALDEMARRKAEADRRIAEYRALLERFRSLIDAGKLKVKIVDGRMVVALASDILFASGSASLSKDGRASIVEVASLLAQIPERKFQVEGHTDNLPIRTEAFPSNWELASARALTVLKAMVEGGMPADRVSAASFGEQKPALANDTPENRAANRRIEIVMVPDLSTLPGFDELQRVGS